MAYIELGEIEKAKNLIDNLHRYALEVENKELIASADAQRAMLFRAQNKWEESIEHFEKSLQQFEAIGARRWNVYWFAKMVLSEYARVYLERDQEGTEKKLTTSLTKHCKYSRKLVSRKKSKE